MANSSNGAGTAADAGVSIEPIDEAFVIPIRFQARMAKHFAGVQVRVPQAERLWHPSPRHRIHLKANWNKFPAVFPDPRGWARELF